MFRRPQPRNESDQVAFCHGGAAGRGPAHPPANMEKDGAPLARHGRIRVMPDFHQPAIGKVVVPHFLFLEPGRRIGRVRDGDKTVIIGTRYVIDPRIRGRYLMKRIIGPRRELGIIRINRANPDS